MSEAKIKERERELFRERMLALKTACLEFHRKHSRGPGGSAICVCGAGGGGSAACGGLGELKNFIRYAGPLSPEWEGRRKEILNWL